MSSGSAADTANGRTQRRAGMTYVVLSGKGGVGKSTVSAALASALAAKGARTGLLDTDLHGPSVCKMLGLEEYRCAASDSDRLEPAWLMDGALGVISVHFLVGESDSPLIWRGPLKHKLISQLVELTNWGDLDYLIIDSPPGTGDEPLSAVQTARPDAAIVVTTPQDVAAFDVRRSIRFCERVGVPVKGIVENMSGFVCPHCGEVTDIFGRGGGDTLAQEMDVTLLGSLPIDAAMVEAADRGSLCTLHQSESPAARGLGRIVAALQ
ncbi:MAG: P-loop NTPase [Chitinivibrionales bacterium]|nr:P-loop NTPase [Chitinivibrionales bacterium]